MVLQILTLIFSGCTTARFVEVRSDGTKVKAAYTYWMQDKVRDIEYDPTTGKFHIKTNNSSDPAVEAFKQGMAAGAGKAVEP